MRGDTITIVDVAKMAGVSVSTVSRILNNKPDVSPSTRDRVLGIIQELGYRPHVQAQSLAGGRSRTIALSFPARHAGFTQLELDFFVGAAQAAGERDYFFNLMTIPMTHDDLLNVYRNAYADGIILMRICIQDWRVEMLRDYGYPFVMIGRCANNNDLSYIDLDFEGAVPMAFNYLVDLGHREIGFLTFPPGEREQGLGPAIRSLEGYRESLQIQGLKSDYLEANLTVQDMYQATLDLLDEHPQMTAIVTVHGATASGIVRALHHIGRRVPEDFSVVPIATDKIAQLLTPPMTSISFPTAEMGYEAARMLIDTVQGKMGEPEQILLRPELILRESTATPRLLKK
jgi:DNA-binding LacI/PurR family transcriptional regulator